MVEFKQVGWFLTSPERSEFISPYVSIQERAEFEKASGKLTPAYTGGVRYCYECGSVGPVPDGKRDCCPDGSHAVYVHPEIAKQAKAGFRSKDPS